MKLVIVESRYKGDRPRNKRYLESCLRDCIYRGESPYASHKMLTDCLDDDDPDERALGIEAGLAWRSAMKPLFAEDRPKLHIGNESVLHVFYIDLGWSDGMLLAKKRYDDEGIPYESRNLPGSALFWKEETPVHHHTIGEATRDFLRREIQERVDELLIAEKDSFAGLERADNDHRRQCFEERLKNVRERLGSLRKAVLELGAEEVPCSDGASGHPITLE